jgi:UDP-N-acetylmuramate dehydrogenase
VFKDFDFGWQPRPVPHTWFRLGGPAEFLPRRGQSTSWPPWSRAVTRSSSRCGCWEAAGISWRDQGVGGVVVQLSPALEKSKSRAHRLRRRRGQLATWISTSVREGLAGLESLVGIPGTVGARCTAMPAAMPATFWPPDQPPS